MNYENNLITRRMAEKMFHGVTKLIEPAKKEKMTIKVKLPKFTNGGEYVKEYLDKYYKKDNFPWLAYSLKPEYENHQEDLPEIELEVSKHYYDIKEVINALEKEIINKVEYLTNSIIYDYDIQEMQEKVRKIKKILRD